MREPNYAPRDAVQLFGDSMRFTFSHLHALLASSLPILVPLAFLRTVIGAGTSIYLRGTLELVTPIMAAVAGAAMLEELEYGRPTVRRIFDRLRGRWGAIVGVAFVQGILTTVGFALLIIPGLIILAHTATAPVVVVAERDTDMFSALRRARRLTIGHGFHVLGTLALSWGALALLATGAGIAVTPLVRLLGIAGRGWEFLNGLGYAAFHAIAGSAMAALYFDLRTRAIRSGRDRVERPAMPATTEQQLP